MKEKCRDLDNWRERKGSRIYNHETLRMNKQKLKIEDNKIQILKDRLELLLLGMWEDDRREPESEQRALARLKPLTFTLLALALVVYCGKFSLHYSSVFLEARLNHFNTELISNRTASICTLQIFSIQIIWIVNKLSRSAAQAKA